MKKARNTPIDRENTLPDPLPQEGLSLHPSEQVFRLALFECANCHVQGYFRVYARWLGIWYNWCPECVFSVGKRHEVETETQTCVRCTQQAYLTVLTFWHGRRQYWCQRCALEVFQVQLQRGLARL